MARAHSLSGVPRWLASVARHPRLERAFSCYSYIEPVARNIDRSIEQAARTVPASADSPVDTSNSSVGRNHMHIVPLPLSPAVKKIVVICVTPTCIYYKSTHDIINNLHIYLREREREPSIYEPHKYVVNNNLLSLMIGVRTHAIWITIFLSPKTFNDAAVDFCIVCRFDGVRRSLLGCELDKGISLVFEHSYILNGAKW